MSALEHLEYALEMASEVPEYADWNGLYVQAQALREEGEKLFWQYAPYKRAE